MADDFTGKVAVVTGGANGIGRATAERLVADGACVVVADVDADLGEKVAGGLGERAAFMQTDVADPDQVHELVAFAVDRFGGLQVMCNVAVLTEYNDRNLVVGLVRAA